MVATGLLAFRGQLLCCLVHAGNTCLFGVGSWRQRLAGARWAAAAPRAAEAGVGGAPPAPAAPDTADRVVQAVERLVKRKRSKLAGLQHQLRDPADADEWVNKGHALLTLPKTKWHRGLERVEVPAWSMLDHGGGPGTVLVELVPDKDFRANAELCFKNARKITRAAETLGPMIEEVERDIERWEARAAAALGWKQELEGGGDAAAPEAGIQQLYWELVEEGVLQEPEPPPQEPDPAEEAEKAFRRKYGRNIDCFLSPGGHEVVVGRSSKTNEYVSLKLAKGDTVWFHADHGIPSSHVLIKAPWDSVSEDDIEYAAKITAYHSKARRDRHVPVMYCQGRHVRKVRGTPTGTVTIAGGPQRSIIVAPGLPEE